jgi:sec-independent protein translocase protein TatA
MVGVSELWPILGIVVLIFGASRLPEIGRGVGEAIRNFKKSISEPVEEDAKAAKKEGE